MLDVWTCGSRHCAGQESHQSCGSSDGIVDTRVTILNLTWEMKALNFLKSITRHHPSLYFGIRKVTGIKTFPHNLQRNLFYGSEGTEVTSSLLAAVMTGIGII